MYILTYIKALESGTLTENKQQQHFDSALLLPLHDTL